MEPLLSQMLAEAAEEARRRGLELRPHQVEVLSHLARGKSVFAGLPTGYGKSLCYWLPAAAWGWKVWVVSPLVSLIEDQGLALEKLGMKVVAWRGGITREQRQALEQQMQAGDWQVCLLSPERLQMWEENGYFHALRAMGLDPDLLVLDEMHCLEEWREFRGGYEALAEPARRAVGRGTLLLGLSASLSEVQSRLWMEELCGEHARVVSGLGRENLSLFVLAIENDFERWLYLLAGLRGLLAPESALVYCATRRECDEVAAWLRSAGFEAVAYHAGLPSEERTARSLAFRAGRLRVICATSAFGMGIDYAYVSRVIHFSLPYDLESYWQEVGRAGRGGQAAWGMALWRRSEITRVRLLEGEALRRYVGLWRAWVSGGCRKKAVAERLGIREEDCGNCDRCFPSGISLLPLATHLRPAWWMEKESKPCAWLESKLQEESILC